MDKEKKKKVFNAWNILAVALIFFGFGMIHGTPKVERIGSIMIGLGSLYLIMVVAKSFNKESSDTQQPQQ